MYVVEPRNWELSAARRCHNGMPPTLPARFLALLCCLVPMAPLAGCAASQLHTATPAPEEVVEMDALRITGCTDASGDCEAEVYDASDLFKRATDHLNAQRCHEAVELYDRLAAEFVGHELVSAAYYNAGLCLQALGEFAGAAERYGLIRTKLPESGDYKHASLQYAEVLVQLERWDEVMAVSDELLARTDIEPTERLEAMARRSQGLLGQGKLPEAARHARSSLTYFRTRPPEQSIPDEFFAAANSYVLAETYRLEGQQMAFPEGIEPQKKVLIRRAELLLAAQREYFNTISFTNLDNLHWAAASGYRIGHMYDELWHSVMAAPVPAHLPPEGHAPYHESLAKLIKPLVRHAIRYWELTLMLIERTGMDNDWSRKTRDDLSRVRALLLAQPAGPGGLPPAGPTPAAAIPAAGPTPTPEPSPAAAHPPGAPADAGAPVELPAQGAAGAAPPTSNIAVGAGGA